MVTTSLAAHLRVVIARTARRLRQEAGVDLSPSQTAALGTVERRGPLTPSELAACERIQRPTATRVIARLEEAGLVGRAAALQFLPIMLAGAWGGLLADRLPKRGLLMTTQALMALPAIALFVLVETHAVQPWMVFALIFARGSVNAIDNPARQS